MAEIRLPFTAIFTIPLCVGLKCVGRVRRFVLIVRRFDWEEKPREYLFWNRRWLSCTVLLLRELWELDLQELSSRSRIWSMRQSVIQIQSMRRWRVFCVAQALFWEGAGQSERLKWWEWLWVWTGGKALIWSSSVRWTNPSHHCPTLVLSLCDCCACGGQLKLCIWLPGV